MGREASFCFGASWNSAFGLVVKPGVRLRPKLYPPPHNAIRHPETTVQFISMCSNWQYY